MLNLTGRQSGGRALQSICKRVEAFDNPPFESLPCGSGESSAGSHARTLARAAQWMSIRVEHIYSTTYADQISLSFYPLNIVTRRDYQLSNPMSTVMSFMTQPTDNLRRPQLQILSHVRTIVHTYIAQATHPGLYETTYGALIAMDSLKLRHDPTYTQSDFAFSADEQTLTGQIEKFLDDWIKTQFSPHEQFTYHQAAKLWIDIFKAYTDVEAANMTKCVECHLLSRHDRRH